MNRELAEVRRYWPKARYAGWNWHGWRSEDEPGVLYRRYSSERCWWRKRYELCLDEEQGGWRVVDSNQDQIGRGATIPEAMRAAGFGVRTLGKHARERVKRAEYRQYVMGCAALGPVWADGAARLLAYCQPQLADRQRPRKGARLGRRKRAGWDKEEARHFAQWREWESPKMTANDTPKWHAVAATYPRYELRYDSEVLAVVRYSPSDGLWTAPRTGGFHTAERAMRWEEMRLNLPTCPVAEV